MFARIRRSHCHPSHHISQNSSRHQSDISAKIFHRHLNFNMSKIVLIVFLPSPQSAFSCLLPSLPFPVFSVSINGTINPMTPKLEAWESSYILPHPFFQYPMFCDFLLIFPPLFSIPTAIIFKGHSMLFPLWIPAAVSLSVSQPLCPLPQAILPTVVGQGDLSQAHI